METKTIESHGSEPQVPGQASTGGPPRFGRKHYVSAGLTLFLVGFLVSFLCLPPPSPTEENSETTPVFKEPKLAQLAETPQALAVAAAADLKRADEFFQEGRFDAALALYQTPDGASPRCDLLQYRIGLCLERLARWDQAVFAFRHVFSHADKELSRQALVSQARVLIRLGHVAEAKNLLYPFLLQSDARNSALQADARYLLAMALSHEALPRQSGRPLESLVVRPPLGNWKTQGSLDEGKNQADPKQADAKIPRIGLLFFANDPEQKLLTAALEQSPVKDVIDNLAGVAGLDAAWSPLAVEQVAGRSTRLAVTNWPLLDVLEAVTGPLRLVGQVEGKMLRISTEKEIDGKALAAHRAAVARAALRTAITLYPGHSLTPAAYLELGNFDEADEQPAKALAWYERLTQEWPRSGLRIEAWFNSGVLFRRQGKEAQACKDFFQVVDHSTGHELTALALVHIGDMYLNQGELAKALPALRRAVAAGSGSNAQPAAVVTLAAAYLVEDKWQLANALLIEKRDLLAEKPYRLAGAFLDAYALFRGARARRETRREGANLFNAILAFRSEKMLGPAGQYLLGKAFSDLAMWEEVLRVYETNKDTSSPMGREMTFVKAEALTRLRKPDQVVPLLNSLALGKDKWASQARYQLAAIALQRGRAQQCLETCMQISRDQLPIDRPALLHLMGEAYERLGQHDKAAKCFAGTFEE